MQQTIVKRTQTEQTIDKMLAHISAQIKVTKIEIEERQRRLAEMQAAFAEVRTIGEVIAETKMTNDESAAILWKHMASNKDIGYAAVFLEVDTQGGDQ